MTLVSLYAASCQRAGKVKLCDIDPRGEAEKAIDRMLDARAEHKVQKYASVVQGAFHPNVLSLGCLAVPNWYLISGRKY